MEAKRKEREEQRLLLTVRIITDETFSRHEGFDLVAFDERGLPLSDLPTFHVPNQETYGVFKSRVAQRFGHPENQIRLWVLVNRGNKTVRPHTDITDISENEASLSTLHTPCTDSF